MTREFEFVEELDDGDTNQVLLTESDTVVKYYSNFSLPVLLLNIGCLVLGDFKLLTSKERIRREKKARAESAAALRFPEIVDEAENYLEFEFIEGEDFSDYASREGYRQVGKKIGNIMTRVQESGIYLSDYMLENFVFSSGEVWCIDAEYTSSNGFNYILDEVSILVSCLMLEQQKYCCFMEGFKSSYGKTSLVSYLIAVPVSIGYAALIDKNLSGLGNAVKNGLW